MGEGKRRKEATERLLGEGGLQSLDVGPGQFQNGDRHVVLLARADSDSLAKLNQVLNELRPSAIARNAINSITKTLAERSAAGVQGWLQVWRVEGGPWRVNQIGAKAGENSSTTPDAIETALRKASLHFALRRWQWTTLVVANPADTDMVRKIASGLVSEMVPRSLKQSKPKSMLLPGPSRTLAIEVSKQDVESGDLSGVLLAMDMFTLHDSLDGIEVMCGNTQILIEGYGDDPRALHEIAAPRAFLRRLLDAVPWLPLICEPSQYHLWVGVLDDEFQVKMREGAEYQFHVSASGLKLAKSTVSQGLKTWITEWLMTDELPAKIELAQHHWAAFWRIGEETVRAMKAGDPAAGPVSGSGRADETKGATAGAEEDSADDLAKNEAEFWESMLETTAPGWKATVDPSIVAGEQKLSELDTFIYAIDARTGWTNAAGFTAAQAQEQIDRMRAVAQDDQALVQMAIIQITNLGKKGVAPEASDAKVALFSALGALSYTATMKMARTQVGSLKGHHFYLVYTPNAGTPFGRPLFMDLRPGRNSILPMDELFDFLGNAVRSDVQSVHSNIGAQIRSLGGLMLCDTLKKHLSR